MLLTLLSRSERGVSDSSNPLLGMYPERQFFRIGLLLFLNKYIIKNNFFCLVSLEFIRYCTSHVFTSKE
jgi:hypothetical protein